MKFTKQYKRLPRVVMEPPFSETYLVKAWNILLLRFLSLGQKDEPGGFLTQICDLLRRQQLEVSVLYKTRHKLPKKEKFVDKIFIWHKLVFEIIEA